MKKLFLLSVVAFIFLTACSRQASTPTLLPSATLKPSSTETPTNAPKPTITPTITSLPTYNTKQVVFEYRESGGHTEFFEFFDYYRPYTKIIMYDDGQMIIPGAIYKQKTLSTDEIKQFFSNIEAMGFYSLESNQAHDPTDKLYDFGNNYVEVYDDIVYCIIVSAGNSRQLCVQDSGVPYLIPKMKKILEYLNHYEQTETTTYYPDRILLYIQAGRPDYLPYKLPTYAIPWGAHLPSLEIPDSNTFNDKKIFVQGNAAKEIYLMFDSTNEGKVFTQNGKEYTVYIDIVLPHEKVTSPYP